MKRFRDRTAVVSGGSGGIGKAVCLAFRDEGARVASLDIRVADDSIQCDIQSADSVNAAARPVQDTLGTPAILVHSAAVNAFADTRSTTEAQFESVMRVNVFGAILLTQAFAPPMKKRGSGAIAHVSSITGIVGAPGMAVYSASKGALITLTRTSALKLAESGIRVNCVCPASVDSPMLWEAFNRHPDPQLARDQNVKRHPLGRLGTPEDVE